MLIRILSEDGTADSRGLEAVGGHEGPGGRSER